MCIRDRIRFPSNDTVTVETGGSTRVQINDNNVQVIDIPLIITRSSVAGNSDLNFGDSADGDTGQIRYRHDDNFMSFTVNTAERLRIEDKWDWVLHLILIGLQMETSEHYK